MGPLRQSKVSVVSDSFKMMSEVGLIRQQARRGVYDHAISAARELLIGKRPISPPKTEPRKNEKLKQ